MHQARVEIGQDACKCMKKEKFSLEKYIFSVVKKVPPHGMNSNSYTDLMLVL